MWHFYHKPLVVDFSEPFWITKNQFIHVKPPFPHPFERSEWPGAEVCLCVCILRGQAVLKWAVELPVVQSNCRVTGALSPSLWLGTLGSRPRARADPLTFPRSCSCWCCRPWTPGLAASPSFSSQLPFLSQCFSGWCFSTSCGLTLAGESKSNSKFLSFFFFSRQFPWIWALQVQSLIMQ